MLLKGREEWERKRVEGEEERDDGAYLKTSVWIRLRGGTDSDSHTDRNLIILRAGNTVKLHGHCQDMILKHSNNLHITA